MKAKQAGLGQFETAKDRAERLRRKLEKDLARKAQREGKVQKI